MPARLTMNAVKKKPAIAGAMWVMLVSGAPRWARVPQVSPTLRLQLPPMRSVPSSEGATLGGRFRAHTASAQPRTGNVCDRRTNPIIRPTVNTDSVFRHELAGDHLELDPGHLGRVHLCHERAQDRSVARP